LTEERLRSLLVRGLVGDESAYRTFLGELAAHLRSWLIFGHTARVCPFLISMIALPVFVALVWVLRGLAPTRLRLTGAVAGFAAGALGALAYSLHCPELAAPFIGIWYLLGMTICAILGAWAGPRLLRW
jgi:hypothetical protein